MRSTTANVTAQAPSAAGPRHPGAGFRRTAAVAALVAAPVLAAASEVLQPELGGSSSERLAAMQGVLPAVSSVTFLVSQLPTLIAIIAIGNLIRVRSRRLSAWGTTLGVIGAFGHTVFGGMSLVWLAMADGGSAHRAAYAEVLDEVMNSPAMLFSIAGLAGTVLGFLLLSIGLFRGDVGPRWVGPVLWVFLVIEFVGTSLTPSASYLSVLCFAAAFLALARFAAAQPLTTWASPVDA